MEEPEWDEYGGGYGRNYCISWNSYYADPVVSLNTSGQLSYRGSTLQVGANPTAVKAYRSELQSNNWSDPWYSYNEETVQPSRALVVNTGSNSVSVIDLLSWQVITNVIVGNAPTGLVINPNETRAYVTNRDSSSVTELNLDNNSTARTTGVGYRPTSAAMDPSGTSVWVGGEGWLSRVDLGSFSVVATYPIDGTITSLASSNGQNKLVYTVHANTGSSSAPGGSSSSSNYFVRELRLSDMATTANLPAGSGSVYENYAAPGSPASMPSLLGGGTQVSFDYGNGVSVSATPEGFLVMDVTGGREIMRGRTATPVRSLAGDSRESVAYLTLPASNQLIRVPLPKVLPAP